MLTCFICCTCHLFQFHWLSAWLAVVFVQVMGVTSQCALAPLLSWLISCYDFTVATTTFTVAMDLILPDHQSKKGVSKTTLLGLTVAMPTLVPKVHSCGGVAVAMTTVTQRLILQGILQCHHFNCNLVSCHDFWWGWLHSCYGVTVVQTYSCHGNTTLRNVVSSMLPWYQSCQHF